jgi:hypothetical protein
LRAQEIDREIGRQKAVESSRDRERDRQKEAERSTDRLRDRQKEVERSTGREILLYLRFWENGSSISESFDCDLREIANRPLPEVEN